MTDHAQRIVDFKPATHPGWTIHYVNRQGTYWSAPLAGWLIRDEHPIDDEGGDFLAAPAGRLPYRSVVAAVCEDGAIEPATDSPSFWFVGPPNSGEPTAQDIANQRAAIEAQRRRIEAIRAGRTPDPAA